MRLAVTGDEAAFAELFRRYEPRVVGYCRRMLRSGTDAEDAAAETFLAIFRRRETYQHPRPFRPWLFAIARNACLARLSRKRPEPEAKAAPPKDPSKAASKREEIDLALEAVERLRPEFREAIRLHYFAGLSTPEISEVLGAPVGTVRSRLARGLCHLRRELGGERKRGRAAR